MSNVKFSSLIGLTLTAIDVSKDKDEIRFLSSCGREFAMHHDQECCETVEIESIVGELNDLIGNPILIAEEATSEETPVGFTHRYEPDSQTWTFYKLATVKGYVDIRWFGESNGYYSESVDFKESKE